MQAFFEPIRKLAILFSGGVDSEVLLRTAVHHLGADSVLALTADTCLLAEFYRKRIPPVCREIGIRHFFREYNPLQLEAIRMNGPERCYFCKKTIYTSLKAIAFREGFALVADGMNLDDLDSDRPGLRAAEEENILHPFVASGFRRTDVQKLGSDLGMSNSSRPSDSCLATRIARSMELTEQRLALIDRLEAPLMPIVTERFRARLGPDGITLEYGESDRTLVEHTLDELNRIAAESDQILC